jgi:RNA polymerase sigma-70 factor (ECF subfamily)
MTYPLRDAHHETDWIALVRAGDTAAFEAMFRRYYEPLLRFALAYVPSREAAEDLVQDVFFRVWEQRERWEVRATLAAYLYGATRNRCLDYVRHRIVEQQWEERAATARIVARETIHGPAPSAQATLELDELDAAIRRAVDRLPDRCRQTFVLSREHGLSYAEIAAVMGISVKTVKIQMGRALKALRTTLAPFLAAAVLLTIGR